MPANNVSQTPKKALRGRCLAFRAVDFNLVWSRGAAFPIALIPTHVVLQGASDAAMIGSGDFHGIP